MPQNVSRKAFALCVGVSICFAAAAPADELSLKDGTTYQGLVLKETPTTVTFEVHYPGGGRMEMPLPRNRIADMKVTGKAPVFDTAGEPAEAPTSPERPAAPTPKAATPPEPTSPGEAARAERKADAAPRTLADIRAYIDAQAKTPPDWWDDVKLNVPKNLDLAGMNPTKKWDPQRNLPQHIFSTITPNPGRWREGIRTLHHVLPYRKDHKPQLAQAMHLLAKSYHRFEKDYARAAFWWEKAIAAGEDNVEAVVGLADCYYQLGSKSMAVALLKKHGLDRQPQPKAITLWGELDETETGLELCEALARQRPDMGYLAAGNLHRKAGNYAKAVTAYEAVLKTSGRGTQKNRMRAQQNLDAIKLVQALRTGTLKDGTYTASSQGYRGPVEVAVMVKGGKIAEVKVVKHREDIFFTAPVDVPAFIVKKQSVENIDTISGATITSEAIINATSKALSDAAR